MKKYLEQRVDELEVEVNLLKAKLKLNETKDTSKYINQYPKHDQFKDYIYNCSINLMSEPDFETAFPSPFDQSEFEKNPLSTVTVKQPTHSDDTLNSYKNLSFDDYPPYPDILGSYDSNLEDVVIINEDITPITPWGFVSEFDKMDKDFLEWLKSNEAKNAYEISKHPTTGGKKNIYPSFKVK
jgi:hypothetical protein